MGSDWAADAGAFASAILTAAAIGSGMIPAVFGGAVSAVAVWESFCSGGSATWVTVPSTRGGVVSNAWTDSIGSVAGSGVWFADVEDIGGTLNLMGTGTGAGSGKIGSDLACQIRAPTKIIKPISPIHTSGRFFFFGDLFFPNGVTSFQVMQPAVVTLILTHMRHTNILACVKSKFYLSIMSYQKAKEVI